MFRTHLHIPIRDSHLMLVWASCQVKSLTLELGDGTIWWTRLRGGTGVQSYRQHSCDFLKVRDWKVSEKIHQKDMAKEDQDVNKLWTVLWITIRPDPSGRKWDQFTEVWCRLKTRDFANWNRGRASANSVHMAGVKNVGRGSNSHPHQLFFLWRYRHCYTHRSKKD